MQGPQRLAVISDTTNAYLYGVDLSWGSGAGVISYYHSDGLGSIRNLTNGSGSKIDSYTYYAFGRIRSSTGGRVNPFRFAGDQLDDTSLMYLRARYYDPSIGRFITRDPLSGGLGDPQSQNPFVYCQNRPTILTDPSGMAGGVTPYRGFPTAEQWKQAAILWTAIGTAAVAIPAVVVIGPTALTGWGVLATGSAATAQRAAARCAPVVERANRVVDRGWQRGRGDAIDALTRAGNGPAWSTVRARYWITASYTRASEFTQENLARMQRGLAPLNEAGQSKQLHHAAGQAIQNANNITNLQELWPAEHYLIHRGHP